MTVSHGSSTVDRPFIGGANIHCISGVLSALIALSLHADAYAQTNPGAWINQGRTSAASDGVTSPRRAIAALAALSSSTSCSVPGVWTDTVNGGVWTISDGLTGKLVPPIDCGTWPATAAVTGPSSFTLSASNPGFGSNICVSSVQVDVSFGESSCNVANGTFTNSSGYSGSATLTRPPSALTIVSPADGAEVDLNPVTTPGVSFQANVGGDASITINWTTQLEYSTSGGKGAFSASSTFTTNGDAATLRTYEAIGGILAVSASASISGNTQQAGPNKIIVAGSSIPNTTITGRLQSLYSGATPNLLTGIAMKESSYRQFAMATLRGYTARWPLESYDGGSHVGLMMMPVSTSHAWNWLVNTEDAHALFLSKISAAQRLENRIINKHPGLRALSDFERENMALVLYGPAASSDLSSQYYTPTVIQPTKANPKGGWDWMVNSVGNADGVAYANSVRALMQ